MNAATRALNSELQLPLAEPSIARTNWRNTGKGFEAEIEATAAAYQAQGIAMLRKVDPPVAIIWPTDPKTGERRQRVIFKRNPFTDFMGAYTARGGQMLAVECKSTATHRLGLREGQLGPDQRIAMYTWCKAGGAVCVLWQWAGRVCLFTSEMIAAAEARGDKSLCFENGIPVPHGTGAVIWDFLPVLAMQ
jgi:penicillin-binding protein-related factor A (putative recombinase)